MVRVLLATCVCALVSGALLRRDPGQGVRQCPPLKSPPEAKTDVVLGGRMALMKCGRKPQVLLCISGRWSPRPSCRKARAEEGKPPHAAAAAGAGGGGGRGRERRSPNTGKYEALRRRVKVQRKIQRGLLAPVIGGGTPSRVRVHAGDDALLMCRVRNLGIYAASWRRVSDNVILAIDGIVLAGDARLSTVFEEQTETWILKISGAQAHDAGGYECQVSTQPQLVKEVALVVVPPDQPLEASGEPGVPDADSVLTNISALWEEVNDLRREVNHHLHHGHTETNHDQILEEIEILLHEHHVHHDVRPHENHNAHHSKDLLDHLETVHGHSRHDHDPSQHLDDADDSVEDDDESGNDHSHEEDHEHLDHEQDAHDRHGLHSFEDDNHHGHDHGHGHDHEHGHHHVHGHYHEHGHHHHHVHDDHDHPHPHVHDDDHHHHEHHQHATSDDDRVTRPLLPPRRGLAFIPGREPASGQQLDPWMYASCLLEPNVDVPESNIRGGVVISQRKDLTGPVFFDMRLAGFDVSQGRVHGFHVHESAVTDGRCGTAGGHFNPHQVTHGGPASSVRHVGDLGNIEVGEDGELDYILSDGRVALVGENSIISKSIVIHEGQDDLGLGGDSGSLTTGNAGGRLACCNIYIQPDPHFRFKG